MARVVVLGGGFGGAAAAGEAAALLGPEHEVLLVDRSSRSYLCGVNPAVVVGESEPVSRSVTDLEGSGVTVAVGEIEQIDLAARSVVASGSAYSWDHLVIALGVAYDWAATPGSRDAFSFYDRESALRLRRRLSEFDRGSILLGVAGTPYRCPPAIFETALMIDEFLRSRGIRDGSEMTVAIPEAEPLGVAGVEASTRIRALLDGVGIRLETGRIVTGVEGRLVRFDDGTAFVADVPVVVPAHRLPPVVAAIGLARGAPFVRVDRHTLETGVESVFAIGDVNTIPVGERAGIPKAGVFASGQGRHAARVIAHRMGVASDPGPYDGVGHCFLMFGRDRGASVGGSFYADGGPDVRLGESSEEGRWAKNAWEESWARFEI